MATVQIRKPIAQVRYNLLYSEDEQKHYAASQWIAKYVERKATGSPGTARAYRTHLRALSQYIHQRHGGISVDAFLETLRKGQEDPYDALAGLAAWLQRTRTGEFKLGANMQRNVVKTAKRFLRFSKVPITNEDFREQVSLPRMEDRDRKPVGKKTITALLNAADVQLKTFTMFSAVFGPRPIEASAVRNRDVDLLSEPGKVTFRAQYSKMRKERTRFMTSELKQQMQLWKSVKYRPHRTTIALENGVSKQVHVEPEEKPDDLFFQHWNPNGTSADPRSVYDEFQTKFSELVERIAPGWEDGGKRREVTLYSFRRFAKTTISDLGLEQFSEYWIGHKKSVYWNKPLDEIIATFRRIEPYLTFLDISQLEAQGAEIAAKVEEIKNQEIAKLKDVIMTLSERLGALEQANKEREELGAEVERLRRVAILDEGQLGNSR